MFVRGFEAASLAGAGGSAFTKKRRPPSSITLAIWPLAACAKKKREKAAQKTSADKGSLDVTAVRFIIRPLPRPGRDRALGKANTKLGAYYRVSSFEHCREAVNVPSVLGRCQVVCPGADRLALASSPSCVGGDADPVGGRMFNDPTVGSPRKRYPAGHASGAPLIITRAR